MDGIVDGGNDPLQRAFEPLIGLPVWFVHKGYGSFLTMEFGSPHLKVREPRMVSSEASEMVQKLFARRRVTPCGEWHLWIYCCNWRIIADGHELAWSESSDQESIAAAYNIDSRLFIGIQIDSSKGTSVFEFEGNTVLQTWPYGKDSSDEQWNLFFWKSGDVFSYRADGHYSCGPGNQAVTDQSWHAR
jgi:hypothetical protein